MRRYSTNRFGTKWPLAAAALLAVACSGPAPDPRELAFDEPPKLAATALLRPATGSVYGLPARPTPSPAPMAEVAEVHVRVDVEEHLPVHAVAAEALLARAEADGREESGDIVDRPRQNRPSKV